LHLISEEQMSGKDNKAVGIVLSHRSLTYA
jgi:hypothetical protein